MAVGLIAVKAVAFLVGSIVLGHFLVPRLLRGAGRLESEGVLLTLAVAFCLLLSWVSAKVGLAPIVGAFAAGLVLDEVHYKPAHARKERDLRGSIAAGKSCAGADLLCVDGYESRPSLFRAAGFDGFCR